MKAHNRIKGEKNPKYKHGGKGSRLYNIWKDMRKRCNNPNATNYKHYGAKGIFVSEVWNDFSAFRAWSEANGYKEYLTIDRIESTGNYEPANCRWVTKQMQHRNQSNNRIIEYNNQKMTVSEACEKYNIRSATLIARLNKGWDTERALTEVAFLGKNKIFKNG
jgi:hypothetical protein